MDIKLRKYEDIYIVDVNGDMDLYNAPTLKDLFAKMVQKQVTKFVINVKKVDYIDSSGVGTLINFYAEVRQKKLQFCLANVSGTVLKVLTLTKLNSFFPSAASVEEAVLLIKSSSNN